MLWPQEGVQLGILAKATDTQGELSTEFSIDLWINQVDCGSNLGTGRISVAMARRGEARWAHEQSFRTPAGQSESPSEDP